MWSGLINDVNKLWYSTRVTFHSKVSKNCENRCYLYTGRRGGWSTGARPGEAELMDLHTRKASSDFLSGGDTGCSTMSE